MKRKWQNPIIELWREYSWSALGVLALLALTLGYIGFEQQSAAQQIGREPADNLYLALLLFSLNPVDGPHVGPFLEVARFVAIVVASIAIFKTLKIIFDEQYQALKLSHVKDHIVICGLGQKGSLLAESLFKDKSEMRRVIVENNANSSFPDTCRELRALPCVGDATKAPALQRARVARAKYVVALCGDDSTNASIAAQTRKILEEAKQEKPTTPLQVLAAWLRQWFSRGANSVATPLVCIVHLVDDNLRDSLEANFLARGQDGACRLEFFNVYDSGAQTLLEQFRLPEQQDVHALVLGADWLGRNVTEQICKNWKAKREPGDLQVTVLGPQAQSRSQGWAIDDELRGCLDGINVDKDEFVHGTWLKHLKLPQSATIYICLEDDNLTLGAALQLRRAYDAASKIEIFACLQNEDGFASLLNTDSDQDLKIFALLPNTCNAQLLHQGVIERIAIAIHNYYSLGAAEWKQAIPGDQAAGRRSAGQMWKEAKPADQASSRRSARHIRTMLAAINSELIPIGYGDGNFEFTESEIEKLAEMEHERWRKEKEAAGWSFAGPKPHPDCQEWLKLSDTSKEKNCQHIEQIPSILYWAGYKIRRHIKDGA